MSENKLLEQIRQLSQAFLRPDGQPLALADGVKAVAEATSAAVIVSDSAGQIIAGHPGASETEGYLDQLLKSGSLQGDAKLLTFLKSKTPLYNEAYPAEKSGAKKQNSGAAPDNLKFSFVPVLSDSNPLGVLVLCKPDDPLTSDQLVLAEVGAALVGMLMQQATSELVDKGIRNRELAEGAFESLSYSEVEAIREILKNINNNESVVIASKIADSLGITRSVIVNALRKFESAGIIESRSLGMKGTFIRVKNTHALEIISARSAKMSSFR